MRSCKFYSPGGAAINRHDGLQMSDEYEFDKPLPAASCVNADMIANNGGGSFTGCGFEREQVSCPFYEAEELISLRRVQAGEDVLALVGTRVKFGVVEYYVIVEKDGEPLFLHTVNAHEYGEGAHEFAGELLDYELEQRPGETQDLDLPQTSKHSYLREVIHEVLVAS